MSGIKIQKVKVAGKYIYAATILKAVKQTTAGTNYGKDLEEIIGHPKQTVDGAEQAATGLYKAIADGDAAAVKAFTDLVGELKLDDTTYDTVVAYANAVAAKAQAAAEKHADDQIGTMSDLATTEKSTLVAAINELKQSISDNDVTLNVAETATDGYLKTYVLSKGNGTEIGRIDIPKDLVVTKGSCVKGTWTGESFVEGEGTGHAIKLEIANQTAPIYINTQNLVDIYTAEKNATKIQLAVSADNVISASIVSGSIEKTDLTSAVQVSLGLADTALQSITGETGEGALINVSDKGEGTTQGISATQKLKNAVAAAEGALQEVEHGTDGDYFTLNVGSKEGNKQTLSGQVKVKTIASQGTEGAENGLATAADVYAYALTCEDVADTTEYAEVW